MEGVAGWEAEPAAQPLPRPLPPWEDPELSGPAGFFRTLRRLLLQPAEFFDNLGEGGWAAPLAFALIVSCAGLLWALFWHLLALGPAGPSPDAADPSSMLDVAPGLLVALMAGSPLLILLNLGVGGLCWWGSAVLVGAGREFTPAWRIFCYAQGAMALGFIPFFGLAAAAIWMLALMYCGARQVYGLSAWGSWGALVIFLTLQAMLMLAVLLGLLAGLAGLGFLLLLG
jgi:hypothetical protein